MESINERELIFKFLFDMKNDLSALKEQVQSDEQRATSINGERTCITGMIYCVGHHTPHGTVSIVSKDEVDEDIDHTEVEESLSLEEKEKEMIRKALVKHRNKRKSAAQELGISERTLYRKIKEYDIP